MYKQVNDFPYNGMHDSNINVKIAAKEPLPIK